MFITYILKERETGWQRKTENKEQGTVRGPSILDGRSQKRRKGNQRWMAVDGGRRVEKEIYAETKEGRE